MTRSRIRTLGLVLLTILLLVGTTVLAAPYGSRMLYRGTFGGDVVELQRRLTALGYTPGSADGMYGIKTREAVVKFQLDYGLVPDGLATKWTFRAVDRAYSWKQGFFYTVVPGDSLWAIAQKTGTQVNSLRWLNQLQDDMLYPDQSLRIPPEGKNPTPAPTPPPAQPAPDTPAPIPPADPVPQPPADPGTQPPPAAPAPSDPSPAQPPAPGGTKPLPVPTGSSTVPDLDPVPISRYEVVGFYAEDWQGDTRSLNSLKTADGKITTVINFSLLIDRNGNVTTREYPQLTAEARARKQPVEGLVHNFIGSGFDADVAKAVLADPAVRAKLVKNLLAAAQQYGLSGINIDIENVPPAQRPNYTALIRELSQTMGPAGLRTTVSIPAKTWDDTKSAWSGAFDYKALGQWADKVIPMAYDEYLPGYYAGPVASLGWVEQVAAFAASQMPPEKVLLGIAGYGYDWKKGTTEGRGISIPQATSLAVKHGAQIQWDAKAQVPWFTYTTSGVERIVYFENARSLEPKLGLVPKYSLGGIAIWRLGLEDPGIWPVIEQKLR